MRFLSKGPHMRDTRVKRQSKRQLKKSAAKQEEFLERRRQALALQILQAEKSHQPEDNIRAMRQRLAGMWPQERGGMDI